jgi:undecaprenyldiphospho-muramoylpentapeptide beta-N-acetylglucosaminyltransferase
VGGGTGGHVHPALAVADELVRRGHDRDAIRFVGAARGLEATAVPAAGYAVDLLPGRGFRRSLRPDAWRANLGAAVGLARALFRAFAIVGRTRPRVVVGVGGYASVPCVVAARALRIPVVIHEQNAAPGLANRLAVRLGARACVSLPGTPLRGARVTGNPVRAEILGVRRAVPVGRRRVAVVGGSLGARRINDAVLALGEQWRDRTDLLIHHVTGRRDYERCRARRSAVPPGDLEYVVVAYEDDMGSLYERATVVVGRAGAVTIAELTATGTPSVLVPLPGAPGDHQHHNAAALVAAGAAVEIADRELDGPRLARELDALLGRPGRLDAMGAAARTLARPDAAAAVADEVEAAAGRSR